MTIRTQGKARYPVKTREEINAINAAYDEMIADKSESDYLAAMDRAEKSMQTEW